MSLTNKQANVANAQTQLGDEVSRATGSGAIAYTLLGSKQHSSPWSYAPLERCRWK